MRSLKPLLASDNINYAMEAHNGLSAKIVEEAGFKVIWASGLTMCASQALRDCNEASWTQLLTMAEFMADATLIPILLDADTGYGNFNNVRRLVRKLEQINIAGMCIEDKQFPKNNSFLDTGHQLISAEEFAGKIKAAKDAQINPDFVVVARIESLIVGASINEALLRADAYRMAGADAILIHHKGETCGPIEIFCQEWARRLPVVLIPTTYFRDLKPKLDSLKPNLIIFANHVLRAATKAMKNISKTLHETLDISSIHEEIDPLEEIFRLQNVDELLAAFKKYQG